MGKAKDIRDHCMRYMDKYGLVTNNTQGNGTSNGAIYSAEALLAFHDHKVMPPAELLFALENLTTDDGRTIRAPDDPHTIDAPDNLIAWGVYAAFSETYAAINLCERVLAHGRRNLYSWNNAEPGKWTTRTFLGRQWQIVVHLRLSLGKWVGPVSLIWWTFAVITSLFSAHQDSYRLSRCLVRVGERNSIWCWMVAKVWRYVQRKRGNTPKTIFSAYFQNDDHFLAVWSKE